MKTSNELKQERASLIQEQQKLTTTARSANRELNEDETAQFRATQTKIESYKQLIADAEAREANDALMAGNNGVQIDAPATPKKEERFSLLRALNALAEGKPLHEADKQVNEQGLQELRAQGLDTPSGLSLSLPSSLMRAQTVTEDSGAKGGALVPSTPQMVAPLQPNLPIASLGVNVLSGLVGDVPLPTSGSFTFDYVGETEDVTATDVGFAGPTLKPKRCAGVVEVSKKLLLQTSFNVEAWIIKQINIAYGNAITVNALNGPGGDAPTGLYSLITSNINTTAGALTHETAVALESLVEAADGTNIARAYLSDTKVRSAAKVAKLDAGSGRFLTEGNELNGYKYLATTLMPTLDTGAAHPIIFGDWNQLSVGYWGSISIMVDPYTKASAGKVRLIVEGYSDVAVTNEKAFAINKVVTA